MIVARTRKYLKTTMITEFQRLAVFIGRNFGRTAQTLGNSSPPLIPKSSANSKKTLKSILPYFKKWSNMQQHNTNLGSLYVAEGMKSTIKLDHP